MSFILFLAAAAAGTAPVADAQPTSAKADGDRIVCKSERFVGSHLSERICKPKSEWERGRRAARDGLDRMTQINVAKRGEGGDAMPLSPAQKGPPPR